jgi:hypothetical protein
LGATLAEMYVSTRKVKAITEELCGRSFCASSISAISKRLGEGLAAFAKRPLAEPFPYLIQDARYERVREAGIVANQAVLIAIELFTSRALAIETHENRMEANRYINVDDLRQHNKLAMRQAA